MGTGRSIPLWKTALLRGRAAVAPVVLALWMVLSAGAAHAQAVKGSIWSVGIGGGEGGQRDSRGVFREGSWVPVQVKLRNLTPAPFVGHLAVEQIDLDGDKVLTIGPEFVLPAGVDERTLWMNYWPRPDYMTNSIAGITSVLILDKNKQVVTSVTTPQQGGVPISAARNIQPGEDLVKRSSRLVVVLGKNAAGWKSFEGMWGGPEAVVPVFINTPNALPDNVLGLDGVDVIVWEADAVKVSDIAPEFQLQAMLQWVKAGGHLIISVATQGQEFLKADSKMQAAMPLTITGTRDIKVSDLSVFRPWGNALAGNDRPLVQVLGDLRPGARPVVGEAKAVGAGAEKGTFVEAPLAVTGTYGQGAVTVVTVDVSNPDLQAKMGVQAKLDQQDYWISFWTAVAGWRQNTSFFTPAQVEENKRLEDPRNRPPGVNQNNAIKDMAVNPRLIPVGERIAQDVDVKDVTAIRILVALAFLALYWLLAGPVGHLILRQYKVPHWSWWIFGGVVVVATAIAGSVVLVLHVNAYDVRHDTFVLGTVNSNQATTVAFYGVYAPVSGPVSIRQPAPPDNGSGLNYLVPMCVPTQESVKAFADPQSYELSAEKPSEIMPVFRNTLKKLQGRWTGTLPGITGTAQYVAGSDDLNNLLSGQLTNTSGYDLQEPEIIINVPWLEHNQDTVGRSYLYVMDHSWKNGQTLDLHSDIRLDTLEKSGTSMRPGTVELALRAIGWKIAKTSPYHYSTKIPHQKLPQEAALERRPWRDDLMYFLGDARNLDDLDDDDRCELARGVGRMTDCTNALHAAGALIVAHAEDVRSPVPLNVNGKDVAGKGNVVFAYVLPVAGDTPRDPFIKAAPATKSILPEGR